MIKVVDVSPIWADNVTILKVEDLDKVVEYPLLDACKLLYKKNIRTIMSSCNKYNAIGLDNYLEEYEGVGAFMNRNYGYGDGYAWIMLDYDSLDRANKDICASLHDNNPASCIYQIEDYFKLYSSDEDFKKRCAKNTPEIPQYGYRTVTLRYPITKETTIEEVKNYFVNLVNKFNNQEKELATENEIRYKLFALADKYKVALSANNIEVTDDMFMQFSLTEFIDPMQNSYGIGNNKDILILLFVIATLDINGLLTEPYNIEITNTDIDQIGFIYKGEDYLISSRTANENGKTLKFGDYTKGEEQIDKEGELLDLYSQFDYTKILMAHNMDLKQARSHFPGK